MPRQRRVVVGLGAPGVGKTGAMVVPYVRAYIEQYGIDSVIALDVSGDIEAAIPELAEACEWPGVDGVGEWFRELTAEGEGPAGGGWGPGLLVMPDADSYLTPTVTGPLRDLWVRNRHLGLDVLLDGHRPQGLPKDLFLACSELWVFALDEPRAWAYLSHVRGLGPIVRHHLKMLEETRPARIAELEELARVRKYPPIPSQPGEALRVFPREGRVEAVRLFKPQQEARRKP